jgi:hypothetical protein
MVDTTINIGGIAIHEPVTALTDYIIFITAVSFYFGLKRFANGNTVIKNWGLFFGLLGLSTFFGGTSHAFFEIHAGVGYKTFWLSMQVINGFAIYFAQQATVMSVVENPTYINKWRISYNVQLIVFIIAALYFQNYLVTIIDNALGLIPIMILHFMDKKNNKASALIAYGLAISFITAIVHGAKLSVHAYFNYNDIAHVFIMLSLITMYKGVKQKAIS